MINSFICTCNDKKNSDETVEFQTLNIHTSLGFAIFNCKNVFDIGPMLENYKLTNSTLYLGIKLINHVRLAHV